MNRNNSVNQFFLNLFREQNFQSKEREECECFMDTHDIETGLLLFCFTSSYKKTHETLSHAGQKATAAFSNVGTAISKKFGDMRYYGKESWECC